MVLRRVDGAAAPSRESRSPAWRLLFAYLVVVRLLARQSHRRVRPVLPDLAGLPDAEPHRSPSKPRSDHDPSRDDLHVLIIVENLPVPLDRRVWLRSQALVTHMTSAEGTGPPGPPARRRSRHLQVHRPPKLLKRRRRVRQGIHLQLDRYGPAVTAGPPQPGDSTHSVRSAGHLLAAGTAVAHSG